LTQRSRQGGFVNDRIGRTLFGLGDGGPQLLFPVLKLVNVPSNGLEIRTDFVGVKTPANDRERMMSNIAGGHAGRGYGWSAF
jgi:hypothetical protein